jgi:hypothetical protein
VRGSRVAVHLIEPAAPTLHVPRGHPCAAFLELAGAECGATPALLYRRVCAHQHARDLYLCAAHERAVTHLAVCRDCANLRDGAHACPVALVLVPEAVDLIRAAAR